MLAHRGMSMLQTIPPSPQSEFIEHAIQRLFTQWGVLPPQSVDDTHWTHTPASTSHTGVPVAAVQSVVFEHGMGEAPDSASAGGLESAIALSASGAGAVSGTVVSPSLPASETSAAVVASGGPASPTVKSSSSGEHAPPSPNANAGPKARRPAKYAPARAVDPRRMRGSS
jgi:hypothetical protein